MSMICSIFAALSISVQAQVSTWAKLPETPGYPEGVLVDRNLVYVSGPAVAGTANSPPSAIHVFDRAKKELATTINVSGEALTEEHALTNLAVDSRGRIYTLSTQLGLIRFRKVGRNYQQEQYGSALPDLALCSVVGVQPCELGPVNLPPLVNDIVFDKSGNAYVSDSLQGIIWKYKNGGGVPEIWFQSLKLRGVLSPFPLGVNGIRLNPKRTHMYIAVTTADEAPTGAIYRLPFVNVPNAANLALFHTFGPPGLPDQLAFASDGTLYVSLAGSNQISVLGLDGTEITTYQSGPTDPIKLDSPAGIHFDTASKSLLIANHASLSRNVSSFAVLQVRVGKIGDPLAQPSIR